MQEASCQMSLSSAITGESGNGICLHSRNSSVHREGEAEMAREEESNLGLWNERGKIPQFRLDLGVWHIILSLTTLIPPCPGGFLP